MPRHFIKSNNIMFDPDCKCGSFHLKPSEIVSDGSILSVIGKCMGCDKELDLIFDFGATYDLLTKEPAKGSHKWTPWYKQF